MLLPPVAFNPGLMTTPLNDALLWWKLPGWKGTSAAHKYENNPEHLPCSNAEESYAHSNEFRTGRCFIMLLLHSRAIMRRSAWITFKLKRTTKIYVTLCSQRLRWHISSIMWLSAVYPPWTSSWLFKTCPKHYFRRLNVVFWCELGHGHDLLFYWRKRFRQLRLFSLTPFSCRKWDLSAAN